MHPNSHHITDALLVKYLLSEASPEEVRTVEAWAGESAENKAYLEQFRQVWEASRKLVPVLGADENAAWQRFQARVEQKRAPVRPIRRSGAWMRIAALFILIAGAALVFYLGNRETPVQYLTLQAAGRPLADTLSDGSVVTLNKNATLSYPDRFTGEQRAVTLKGEAFFSITPDKEKPFIITVNDVTVKVVGTSFNVRSEGGKTEVIVETGVVDVIRNNSVIRLRPKEKAVVKKDSAMYKVEETEKLYNHYRTREFVCDGTPLWKLVAVLNEAYDARIVIGRDDLRNLPLNTTFHNESLDRILEIIGATFDITVTRRNDQIILH
ncbi:FecR domain-containing protein [Flavisolibacter sp. BT320]|nr:FecR domain-containing protein [Flavisolibacter longurius]